MKNKTFTLIEMLIVIVIIGILAAALVPRLQSVQGRARDTRRKTDLRSINQANEVFKLDNDGIYARPSSACAYNTNCYAYSHLNTGAWIASLSGIMTTIPVDPVNRLGTVSDPGYPGPWDTGSYVYSYGNVYHAGQSYQAGVTNATYDLSAQLENTQDPDRCWVKLYTFVNGTWCGTWSRQLYEFSPDSRSY